MEEFTPCETCEEWPPEGVSCPGCVFWDLIQDFIRLQNALAEAVECLDEACQWANDLERQVMDEMDVIEDCLDVLGGR